MRWYVKAAVAQLMDHLPGGDSLHHFVQRNVTRTLPLPEADFRTRFNIAVEHVRNYLQYGTASPIASATFMEFGAGWDLAIPLTYTAAGVRRQLLYDITPLVQADLVALSVERIRKVAKESGGLINGDRLPAQGPATQEALRPWLKEVGIEYHAPGDARFTGEPDDSIDCVTSTTTMEHIPAADISSILQESYRILRPGGIVSCQVDMSDHFSHSDPAITPWHFLRFTERKWSRIAAPMLYHNRLRGSAHVRMVREVGFEVLRAEPTYPGGLDVATAPLPPIHPEYRSYESREDLLATQIMIVGRKPR
jgi:SAM-dependent methyltransferase